MPSEHWLQQHKRNINTVHRQSFEATLPSDKHARWLHVAMAAASPPLMLTWFMWRPAHNKGAIDEDGTESLTGEGCGVWRVCWAGRGVRRRDRMSYQKEFVSRNPYAVQMERGGA